jgi:uncharacterized protein
MNISEQNDGKHGLFYVMEDGKRLAEMDFVFANSDIMIINHTEVDEKLEGKGVGKQLVTHAIEYAREKNLKVIPLCTFAKSVIDRTPEYQDILHHQ